jgi:hypothetical protein
MAILTGYLPLQGTLGNLSFYRSRDGRTMVRRKGGADANRIASDPLFQRTRENNEEFKRAANAGKLLRNAFRSLITNKADYLMVPRLTGLMKKIIQSDKINDRGMRQVMDGDLKLLRGFEFNINSQFANRFNAPYQVLTDQGAGQLEVIFPSFIPQQMITLPGSATHFKIISGGAAIDFENNSSEWDVKTTPCMSIDNFPTNDISLNTSVTPNTKQPLFAALGIEFYQEVNGKLFELSASSFNSVMIAEVSPRSEVRSRK